MRWKLKYKTVESEPVQKVQELNKRGSKKENNNKQQQEEKNYPRTEGHWVAKVKEPTKGQYKERKVVIKAHNCEHRD